MRGLEALLVDAEKALELTGERPVEQRALRTARAVELGTRRGGEFDPGNAGMRLGLGFAGKSYVGGTIGVSASGKPTGSLRFSCQPNLTGTAMAREAASGIALKLSNGDRDKELHPLKKKG